MKFEKSSMLMRAGKPIPRREITLANLALGIGIASVVLPTMYEVARDTWSTEQGGHGPLVLVTGLWAIWRELRGKVENLHPGSIGIGLPFLALALSAFILARVTGILEIEGFAMYGALIAVAYLLWGSRLIKTIWFPLVYLAFTLPPPDTVVAAVTQPIKIAISSLVVTLLHWLSYPVASTGVTIQIGQYELLVAAACAGLNSIITLTALCLFYVYLRHRSDPVAFVLIAVAAVPVAVISNFVRVLLLVLITYHLGDAAAQGFLHDFAGLLMFAVALFTIFGIDKMVTPLIGRSGREGSAWNLR